MRPSATLRAGLPTTLTQQCSQLKLQHTHLCVAARRLHGGVVEVVGHHPAHARYLIGVPASLCTSRRTCGGAARQHTHPTARACRALRSDCVRTVPRCQWFGVVLEHRARAAWLARAAFVHAHTTATCQLLRLAVALSWPVRPYCCRRHVEKDGARRAQPLTRTRCSSHASKSPPVGRALVPKMLEVFRSYIHQSPVLLHLALQWYTRWRARTRT
jgi:hypothetical protein